jgi:putative transposase
MPRVGRIAPGGVIYHVLNRGNGRKTLFHKDADYAAFVKLLAEVTESVPVRVLAYCLMPNHWHLVLWPRQDGELSKFMLRLTTAHVRRCYAHYRRTEGGHLYQGRFKNFPIEEDRHLLTVIRYVEANALRARLVKRAEQWPWNSLHARAGIEGEKLLDDWPVDRPADWAAVVNSAVKEDELETLRTSVVRGRPYGSLSWVQRTAERLGLQFTLRPRGRPRDSKKKK